MAEQETLFPFEFFLDGVPVSQRSIRSKAIWKARVADTARLRRHTTYELGFLDDRPVSVLIFYFSDAPMQGDIDNIVKPILDSLVGIAYPDDGLVERVTAQKFEPQYERNFSDPSAQLAAALDLEPPIVYVRIDDDLSWRRL